MLRKRAFYRQGVGVVTIVSLTIGKDQRERFTESKDHQDLLFEVVEARRGGREGRLVEMGFIVLKIYCSKNNHMQCAAAPSRFGC